MQVNRGMGNVENRRGVPDSESLSNACAFGDLLHDRDPPEIPVADLSRAASDQNVCRGSVIGGEETVAADPEIELSEQGRRLLSRFLERLRQAVQIRPADRAVKNISRLLPGLHPPGQMQLSVEGAGIKFVNLDQVGRDADDGVDVIDGEPAVIQGKLAAGGVDEALVIGVTRVGE